MSSAGKKRSSVHRTSLVSTSAMWRVARARTAPLAISRYVLDLKVPGVSLFTQEMADFVSGQIVGTLVGMAFRWWAFRRFVFPHKDVRRQVPTT